MKSVNVDWWEEILASAPSLVPGVGVPSLPCSGSPHTERTLVGPRLLSELLSPCVHAIGPSGGTGLLCFISGALAGFENSKLCELNMTGTPLILWERVLMCCAWSWFTPDGQLHEHYGLGVHGEEQPEGSIQLAALRRGSCANDQGILMVPVSSPVL